MKYLLWALVIYLGWRWLAAQKKSAADSAATSTADSAADSAATAENGAEQMVQCAQCGIHLPISESITGSDRKLFCSQEHSLIHRPS
jgi:uncharacterized protein